jgi:hypothetical protein
MSGHALDAAKPTPPRAAVDDLELEPTACFGDDESLGGRESADLADLAIEEAAPAALASGR